MPKDDFFIVLMNQLDETQEKLVQASIKEGSSNWWHHMREVWVVQGGESADWWRKRLDVFVIAPGAIVVLKLPPTGSRNWSARGPKAAWAWMEANYATASGGPIAPREPEF